MIQSVVIFKRVHLVLPLFRYFTITDSTWTISENISIKNYIYRKNVIIYSQCKVTVFVNDKYTSQLLIQKSTQWNMIKKQEPICNVLVYNSWLPGCAMWLHTSLSCALDYTGWCFLMPGMVNSLCIIYILYNFRPS